MSMKISTSIFALSLGILASSAANAADVYNGRDSMKDGTDAPHTPGTSVNWTGFYIGGQAGYGLASHDLKADLSNYDSYYIYDSESGSPVGYGESYTGFSGALDGIGGHGFFGGINAGADRQFGNFVVGIFGNYNFSSVKTEASADYFNVTQTTVAIPCDGDCTSTVSTLSGGSTKIEIEEGDSWVAGARLGRLFGDRALLYGLVGYGQTDVTYKVDDESKDEKFSGLVVGAGGEYALTQNVFIGIEYQHFFGEEKTIASDEESGNFIKDDMSTDKVMGTLKIKLNSGLPNFD